MSAKGVRLFRKFALGVLFVVPFSGAFILVFLGLLIPLREYQWDSPAPYSMQTSDDSALFIFSVCILSIVFLGVSWLVAVFGKVHFIRNIKGRLLYLFVMVACLVRMVYVWPYLHG